MPDINCSRFSSERCEYLERECALLVYMTCIRARSVPMYARSTVYFTAFYKYILVNEMLFPQSNGLTGGERDLPASCEKEIDKT